MKRSEYVKRIAQERIQILWNMCREYPEYAKRYVLIARKLSMKAGIPLPTQFKRHICKKCGAYLFYGKNATIRLENKVKKIKCGDCDAVKNIPYNPR